MGKEKSIKRRRQKWAKRKRWRKEKGKGGGCRTLRKKLSQLWGGRRPGDSCHGNRGTDAGDGRWWWCHKSKIDLQSEEDEHVNMFFLYQTFHSYHLPRRQTLRASALWDLKEQHPPLDLCCKSIQFTTCPSKSDPVALKLQDLKHFLSLLTATHAGSA